MGITKTKPFLCNKSNIYLLCKLLTFFSLSLRGRKSVLLPLLLAVFVLAGCKTVPIQDRYLAGKGGIWEQDENSGSRFHHNAIADNEIIGLMHASGKSALLNGTQVKNSSEIKNNAFVATGFQSGARIAFKASDSACLIRVDEFNIGRAYTDTSDCQQSIKTIHAMIEAKSAILHINVSQYQTEVMVISGVIEVILREDVTQSIDVRADQEIIITHDTIGRPHPVTADEIWQRIRWRTNFQLYKTVIDWEKIIKVAGIVLVVAAAILLSRPGSHSGLHRPHRWR